MKRTNKDNNNFRTLDGGSEMISKQAARKIPDTYAEVLAGDQGHPIKSGSSYDNSINTDAGAYGDKGMPDHTDGN